jgi:hypothetical protein
MTDTSPRRQLAQRIATFIIAHHLANPFGGEVEQSSDRRSYGILLSIPRLLDGEVRVYSPRFILIRFEGPLGNGDWVFESEQNALDFLRLYLVEHNQEAARNISTKSSKR